MSDQRPPVHPLAAAADWVAKITTVALEMVLPTVGGAYLDRHWGTRYGALLGLILGVSVGLWHLLQLAREANLRNSRDRQKRQDDGP